MLVPPQTWARAVWGPALIINITNPVVNMLVKLNLIFISDSSYLVRSDCTTADALIGFDITQDMTQLSFFLGYSPAIGFTSVLRIAGIEFHCMQRAAVEMIDHADMIRMAVELPVIKDQPAGLWRLCIHLHPFGPRTRVLNH